MKIKFEKNRNGFHLAVTKAVNAHFGQNNKKANALMYLKTLFFLSTLLGSYFLLILGGFGFWINILFWIGVGLSSVFLAVNCGHDAIHGAYSNRKWVNQLMSASYNLLGANAYMWNIQHNIVHHTFTNINGADEDIESVPFARLTPAQRWRPIQRFQHIWVFVLYAFGTLFWVFAKDYKKFFQKRIGAYDTQAHPPIQYFNLFFFKLLYYFLFIAIPISMIDLPWYLTVLGFVVGHLVEGFTIAIIFALAHVVEKAHFPVPDLNGNMENNWAVHQMYTTVDFGRDSALTRFFTGGLNFQIEHHLFPGVCHVHYPAISKIVQATAAAHGVPYHDYPTLRDALRSHIRLLKQLGNNTYARPVLTHVRLRGAV